MPDTVRLSKRVVELTQCSRMDAERYIEGGWVKVDGVVIEAPQHKVSTEHVEVDPAAALEKSEPATLLLHRAAGTTDDLEALSGATHWPEDLSGVRHLQRHVRHLSSVLPLEREASGLCVLTQDPRVQRQLTDDANLLEQEFVVDVSGQIAAYGLQRLIVGLRLADRTLPPCKVSWQNEFRLRFALKGVRPGQLQQMCTEVGLQATAIRRLRIGRIALAKMPAAYWRYVPVSERF